MDAVEEKALKQPFTQAELDQLHGLAFKRSGIERLLKDRSDLNCEFHRYLLRMAAPNAIAYDRIMRSFGGSPVGIEFKAGSRDAWAFILPDASEPGRMRLQYFDKTSFFSHHPYDTVEECVDNMVSEGYTLEDQGALDRVSNTDQWRRGVEVAALIQRLNAKQITHQQFNELVSAL